MAALVTHRRFGGAYGGVSAQSLESCGLRDDVLAGSSACRDGVGELAVGISAVVAVFQLVLDVIALATATVRRRWVRIGVAARYCAGFVAVTLSSYAVMQAIRVPEVRNVTIGIKGLPEEFEGYRIVQLTDLHISRLFQADWVETTVTLANEQKADLVVLTGDLIDGDLQARRRDVAPLSKLEARDGVYVIPGNHEYYFGQHAWMKQFEELGMTRIDNGHVVLSRGKAELVLAGVNDLSAENFGLPGPDLAQALSGAPERAPVVLLDHQPKRAREAAGKGIALQLSGHTHGGMIVGFDRLIATFNGGFVSGLYDVDGMKLYVNNGSALWIGFALRLGVPSELTVITLKREG
ncbi:metallophosphoesterase [Pararhizobium arenae]|uniref:metallophosphoesterase n=1 Tax=Pararhizobium arenae TaxID=1856850 RepID=UPI003159FA4B